MRIVSGDKKGIRLKGPYSKRVRPVMDKVKDSIFSMLYPLELHSLKIVDIFAGTGSVGLEALSRGGKECLFVESDKQMVKNILDNIKLTGYESKTRILNKDFRIALKSLKKKKEYFDLVFSDPPYNLGLVEEFLNNLYNFDILSENGLLVMEIDKNEIPEDPKKYSLRVVKQKSYGRTNILIFKK